MIDIYTRKYLYAIKAGHASFWGNISIYVDLLLSLELASIGLIYLYFQFQWIYYFAYNYVHILGHYQIKDPNGWFSLFAFNFCLL